MKHGDPKQSHDAAVGQFEPDGAYSWMCSDCDDGASGLTRDEAIDAAAEHTHSPTP